MEISLKKVVAIALAGAAGMGAVTASADVVLPNSGNGELTLFVRNDTTGVTYARGLQIQLDNVLTQAAIVGTAYTGPSQAANYVLPSIGPDANLTSFLNGTDSFSWTIMAGDNTGGIAVGDKRYVTTTQRDLSGGANVTTTNLASSWNSLYQMQLTLNGFLEGAAGNGDSTIDNGQWRQAGAVPGSGAGDWFGIGPNNVNDLGSAANFYLLAGSGSGGQARVYILADVTLRADGTLFGTAPAPVPLPAAVWLLGSGLIGLAGIGRRRKNV